MATATAPAPTAQSPVQIGLFDSKLPPRVIIASFFFLTLPLVALSAITTDKWFVSVYIWLFGVTHFVLTLSVYLQSENLKYFRASAKNIFLFFVVPLAILMSFYVIGVLQLNARWPLFAIGLGIVIRVLDFNHLNRQTYGVYQMFKARTGLRPPAAIKKVEQAYLFSLTALMLTTFLAGGVCPLPAIRRWSGVALIAKPGQPILSLTVLQPVFVVLAWLTFGLAVVNVTLLVRAWKAGGQPRGIGEAFGYIGVQTGAALFAVVSFPLYFATLATHYVEYHVLMYPRCFKCRLNETKGLDRWFGRLRRNTIVFYGAIVLVAGIVLVLRAASGSPALTLPYRAVVSIFDGLFVFHYFVEMLIWRFSDPFFRKTLGSLYFTPRPRAA